MSRNDGDRLRFGVIGTGEFAESCHVPGLQSHPQAVVVALCGSDFQRTRALADRLGVADVHTDFRELCARPDLDGVTIATSNAFHSEHALAALSHGKHVFCEKPLAISVQQARKMVDAAISSGRVHQVGFTFRYGYAVRELRRRVHAGDIGAPYYLRIQYDSWKGLLLNRTVGWQEKQSLAGGGILFELGSHLFDIAVFILGSIERTTGFMQTIPSLRTDRFSGEPTSVETDDIAAAWFRHQSGVRGQWFISRATPPHTENGYVEVIGPDGALKAGLSRGSVDILKVSRPTAPDWEELPLLEQARDGKPHCLGIMMRSFVDACIRGELDRNVDASFHSGLEAQLAIEAVMEANEKLTWVPLGHTAWAP